jgi:eukaryotic-like serine/threonine-protein kinase
LIGEILGEYRIVSPLGAGGVGEAYVAEHTDLGTKAAVEVIAPAVMARMEAVQKYLHTIRIVARLQHAGTLKVVDAGIDGQGRGYVVFELLDIDPLARRIQQLGRLSTPQIAEVGLQVANVLAALHDEGVVHGDLRPDVILLAAQSGVAREPVKLAEVGVAALKRAIDVEIGPVYTAPELLGSGEPIDWRVDAYSLGCVTFEMATGRPPFQGQTADEVRTKHREAVPPAARSHMPDVPPSLDVLIGRLLSKKPDDRFGSMREIARAFEALAAGSARPLTPTAQTPAVDLGEIESGSLEAKGEIQAKAAPSAPRDEPLSSIIAPDGSTTIDPAPRPAPHPAARELADSTMSIPRRQPSRLPLVLVLVVIVLGGIAAALLLTLR